ncbi:phosphate ABC transporter substrate-binding protein PstS, partial [Stenotrophomonas rhizophila]
MIHAFKSRAAVAVLAASSVFAANAADVTGAGASFIYPVMSKWSADYNTATGKKVNYQSIGSGGGIAQIKAATVDFGSSDAPLKPEELAAAGLAQFPSVIGGVVPVINVAGIAPGALKLDGPTLANIFLGKIKTWNDPAIAALNPGVKLSDGKITVVHRSDGSGTTFNFVNYLSKVNPEWKSKVGEGTSVQWPVGIGGKGNEGVAAYVKQIKGG